MRLPRLRALFHWTWSHRTVVGIDTSCPSPALTALWIFAALVVAAGPTQAQWGPPAGQRSEGTAAVSIALGDLTEVKSSLREFLHAFPKIRFFIVDAPGNGHQTANLRVMRRLRELGFEGEFQVVYDDVIASKLAVLLPEFIADIKAPQRLSSADLGSVELVAQSASSSHLRAEKLVLGILGANDQPSDFFLARRLNVQNLLQLQPRLWLFRSATREILFANEDRLDMSKLTNLGPVTHDQVIADIDAYIQTALTKYPDKLGWTRDLFRSLSKVDLLPAYSVDFPGDPAKLMTGILAGLVEAKRLQPDLLTKPLVIPVFTEFKRPGELETLREKIRAMGISFLNVRDSAALASRLTPGQITVVHVGAMPPAVFDAIFTRATLPALLEGKNLTNIMVDHGLPFLNVIGSRKDIEGDLFSQNRPDAMTSIITGTFNAMDDRQSLPLETRTKMLAQFFIEAKKPNGLVRTFFASLRKDPDLLDSDLVAQTLFQLRDGLKQRGLMPPPLPRGARCSAVW